MQYVKDLLIYISIFSMFATCRLLQKHLQPNFQLLCIYYKNTSIFRTLVEQQKGQNVQEY